MRLLLIDTCGEGASIALAEDSTVLGITSMSARSGSAMLLNSVKHLLQEARLTLEQVGAVGVVSGPGSFTGVRVGLSCAKGLCEAMSIPLAAVSRLQVLALASGLRDGFAVLNAGRGEVFVFDVASGEESLEACDSFAIRAAELRIAVCEQQLVETFSTANVELHKIDASTSLGLVLRRLDLGGDDLAAIDANYLRGEQQIYGKKTGAADATA